MRTLIPILVLLAGCSIDGGTPNADPVFATCSERGEVMRWGACEDGRWFSAPVACDGDDCSPVAYGVTIYLMGGEGWAEPWAVCPSAGVELSGLVDAACD